MKSLTKPYLVASLPVALVTFLSFPAANAAPLTASCIYDGTNWLAAGTANPCAGTLAVGDKVVDSFGFTTYVPVLNDAIRLSSVGGSGSNLYNLDFNPADSNLLVGTAGAFNYAISIAPPNSLNGWSFLQANANINGTTAGTFGTTLTSGNFFGGGSSTTGANGASGPSVLFNSGLTTAVFSQTWSITSGTVFSLGATIAQRDPSKVPGPLPLLGAGAAFGFSRKLRQRIKLAA